MHQPFETSVSRRQQSLCGRWEFVTDPDDAGEELGYPEAFPDDAGYQQVPGTWNTTPTHHGYEGPAWYRRAFRLPEATDARLRFGAVAHDATVWIDGEIVASHYGGYTPFEAHLPNLSGGTHEVVVRVDNAPTPTSVPLPDTDWFPYGGITREVTLETLPKVYIDDVAVAYELDGDAATVSTTVTVRNTEAARDIELSVSVGDAREARTVALPAGESVHRRDLELSVDRWTPDDPTLYDVRARIASGSGLEDDRCDRIGFRKIEVTDTDLLLNGDPIEVAGVNRHEDHPDWGHAVPPSILRRDLDIVERAGCNAIRTSHYPNHPRFLDYCDERGLLVIEEIPLWQYDADDFARDPVLERGEQMLTEMIARDRHHPSVVAWSLHNECYNQQESVADATRRLADRAREIDNSRPLTLASNTRWRGHEDHCLRYVDFVCLNAYWGWYDDDRDWSEFLKDVRSAHPDKPIVVSEFGAGAVEGERTWEGQKWSEGYQADLLESTIGTFRDTEYVAGWFVWQYCDTRTDPRKAMRRPKTKNNKGIVGEYRRPKEAYRRLRSLLRDADGNDAN